MRVKSLIYVFAGVMALVMSACRPKIDGERVLSQDKFSEVLADVYLTDAMLTTMDNKSKSNWRHGMEADLFQDAAYQWILSKHGISDTQFYASVRYYTGKPNLINGIFEAVQGNLEDVQRSVERRKARREAEEERKAYERKWKTVYISPDYLKNWSGILSLDSLTLEKSDSILEDLKKLIDICPDETTPAYWDSIHKVEAFILDSLRLDSLRLESLRLESLKADSVRTDSLEVDSI